MAWRDQLQQGAFRGVEFYTLASDSQFGRRNVVHEYPRRDMPYAEDLGRRARQFSLEAFTIGADYMRARDLLIDAIEKPGAGELVHPYYGRMSVVVVDAGVSESTDEGGMAQFRLTFIESGEKLEPSAQSDTRKQVDDAAETAQAAAMAQFADNFSVAGVVDFVAEQANTVIDKALAAVQAALSITTAISGAVPGFFAGISLLSSKLTTLARTPAALASGLIAQVLGLSGAASTYTGALTVLRTLFAFGDRVSPALTATPTRRRQALNQSAVVDLVRQTAVIEAARVLTQLAPANYDDAIQLRDEIANQLEAIADSAPDNVYAALVDLRVAVIRDIDARAADLARRVKYTSPATLPALVVSYHLYGDTAHADAIVARNRIERPGFVPGGRPLEVTTS